jgi:hypothetical protein
MERRTRLHEVEQRKLDDTIVVGHEVFDQVHRTWDAGSAMIDALAPRPHTPPGEHR